MEGTANAPAVPRVLVAEDEPDIAALIAYQLTREGFRVETAGSGSEALDAIGREIPDLVVLDRMLPGLSGDEVLRQLKTEPATANIPVLVLTAKREQEDRIEGLELGADDYLTKPFSPRELVARVRAVLRRSEPRPEAGDTVRAADLVLDVSRMRAELAGRAVDLTPTEFRLLETLARRPGRIFTRSQLLDAIRGVAFESYERAIDSHVKNLRRKLEPDPRRPRYVLTVYGVGYRFADDRDEAS
jgi:two-component system OmpR family response regulator